MRAKDGVAAVLENDGVAAEARRAHVTRLQARAKTARAAGSAPVLALLSTRRDVVEPRRGSILLVSDDLAMRASLRDVLDSAGYVVEISADVEHVLERSAARPDLCLVLDLRLSAAGALAVLARLGQRGAAPPIVLIAGVGAPVAVVSMQLGDVSDGLPAETFDQSLLTRVRTAMERRKRAQGREARSAAFAERLCRLTPREGEVLEEIAAGATNKCIAAALGISDRTVEVHRGRIKRKLEVESQGELLRALLELELERSA